MVNKVNKHLAGWRVVWNIFSEKSSIQAKEASKAVSLAIAEQEVSENLYRTLGHLEHFALEILS